MESATHTMPSTANTQTQTYLDNLIEYRIYRPLAIFCTHFKLITQHSGEGFLCRVITVILAIDATAPGRGGGVATEE